MKINTNQWFDVLDEPNQSITPCEDCPYPESCVHYCAIENYRHENVAKIRGEEQE